MKAMPPPPPASLEAARYHAGRQWFVAAMVFIIRFAALMFMLISSMIVSAVVGNLLSVPLLAALVVNVSQGLADDDMNHKSAAAIEDARCVQGNGWKGG